MKNPYDRSFFTRFWLKLDELEFRCFRFTYHHPRITAVMSWTAKVVTGAVVLGLVGWAMLEATG